MVNKATNINKTNKPPMETNTYTKYSLKENIYLQREALMKGYKFYMPT
jgi:hypothetical protein